MEAPPVLVHSAERGGALRLALACTILALEGIALTSVFDTAALRASSHVWARLLAHSAVAFPAALAVGAAWAATSGRTDLRAFLDARSSETPNRQLLVAHVAAVTVFSALTWHLFDARGGDTLATWFLLLVWAATGASTALSILALAVPVRALLFPVRRRTCAMATGVVVGLAAYSAGSAGDAPLWRMLGALTLRSVAVVLGIATGDVLVDVDELAVGTPDFVVRIGAGCSGYEGMGLLWVFLCVHLWLRRDELRFPHALLLLPLGTLLSFGANVVRIAALVLIGDTVSPELAVGAFHSRAGWVLFCGLAIGLAVLARRASFFRREPASDRVPPGDGSTFLLPLVVFLGAGLLLATASARPGDVEWLRFLAPLLVVFAYRRRYSKIDLRPSAPALFCGAAVFVFWLASAGLAGEPLVPPEHLARVRGVLDAETVGWLVARFAGSALVVPLVEELAFRGYLVDRLGGARGRLAPLVCAVSSVLFGLAHERWLAGAVAGAAYFAIRSRRGLGGAIVAHAVTNLLLLVVLVSAR